EWVYNNIEKRPVLSIPSALDVLATAQGDCNEHTVLYTALARCAGVPTRIAIGIVWSEDYRVFYYHAWPEVYANGRWTWIDPTLGQPLADATHIKLLTGGLESWWQLVPFLGQLKVKIESIE
ncbi:MAG: transglutaminase domain-containing protein, partial [Candidatus Hydrogenedentes bacterium]|nr:transglutaminase domain-containing protein [Candidatus Hydrogenedentota bacterium]